MEIILDTNALSAYADGVPGAVTAVHSASSLALPVIAIGEYRFGIARSRHHQDYVKWLERFLPLCRVLDITEETTHWYASARAELRRAGTPIPSNDLWIAALARQHTFSLLSRDTHFDKVTGLRRLSW
jgi:tRNA(fMet)-specific endonuclease VapC